MAPVVSPLKDDRPHKFGDDANVIQTLDAFYQEHRVCGELDAGVKSATDRTHSVPEDVQWVAWMECPVCQVRCEATREGAEPGTRR